MSDTLPFTLHIGGRTFRAEARRSATGWVVECRGARETLTAAARTILDAQAALRKQIEARLERVGLRA